MNCKKFERCIPDFINKTMDFKLLEDFCQHMEQCEGCREELDIQFLVTESLQRLEDGDAFDLQNELNGRLEEAKHKLKLHHLFIRIGIVLEILVTLVILGIIIWLIL